jgi:hypothetical protein
MVIDHRFGDVPLEWVFKSPLGHDIPAGERVVIPPVTLP